MFRCIFSVRLPSFQCLYCGLPCPPTVFTLSPYPYFFPLHTWASQVIHFHFHLSPYYLLSLSISSLHFHSLSIPILLHIAHMGLTGISLSLKFVFFREAPLRLAAPLFGHCPNSDYTPPPPPALKRALWGTFFPGRFEQICQITVLTVHKCTKHPGKP